MIKALSSQDRLGVLKVASYLPRTPPYAAIITQTAKSEFFSLCDVSN